MEDLIMRLSYLGIETSIAPKNGLLELKLIDKDDRVITTQYGESYEDIFAKALVKLSHDSVEYRQLLISKKGLSVL